MRIKKTGTALKLPDTSVIDSLNSTSSTNPLAANQGRILNEKITSVEEIVGTLNEELENRLNGGVENE